MLVMSDSIKFNSSLTVLFCLFELTKGQLAVILFFISVVVVFNAVMLEFAVPTVVFEPANLLSIDEALLQEPLPILDLMSVSESNCI